MSDLEERFAALCGYYGLDGYAREFQFAKPRRYRFDFAWPDAKLAVECEGGVWTNGRHTRGSGFVRDVEKYNLAVLMGWAVLRVTSGMLRDDPAAFMEMVRQLLKEAR